MKSTKPTLKATFLLISAILFLVSWNSFAQEQFRLSDYKNPDYRWQKLDLGFRLGGNSGFDKHEIENGQHYKNIYSQFNSGLNANYYGTKNSASYQGYQDFGLGTDLLTSRDKFEDLANDGNGTDHKYRSGRIMLSGATINRFYNQKKRFFETDLNLIGEYGHSAGQYSADQEPLPYPYKSNNNNYRISASLPLLVGAGRIEEVQDARLAVYILDDLLASGDLKRAPTAEETMAFSGFITLTKNQRFFDTRIRKIAEITAIDSFLTVLNLKAESDASYYTLLNDNWDNANGPVRSAGGRFSVGLAPELELTLQENEQFWRDTLYDPAVKESYSNWSEDRFNAWGLDFVSGYTWEKPANLYWQHTIDAGLVYSLYQWTFNMKDFEKDSLVLNTETRANSPNARVHLGYNIGYYPNSRTQITMGINTAYNQFWGDEVTNGGDEIDIGRVLVNNSLHLTCYYYISPQVRFMLSLFSNYSYIKQNQDQPESETGDAFNHDFQNSISASLFYSIF
ncbi:MAG: hypothetical protein HGA23_02720 [Bacteroidales bacterium]|nr:hypothetical protein [Bacteroidales bacterium]